MRIHNIRIWTAVMACVLCTLAGAAQSTPAAPAASVLRYTPQQLAQRAEALAKKCRASGSGSASEVLEKQPTYIEILGYRDKDGGAELHRYATDIDVVLDGTATLITGGAIVDAMTTGSGEVRGKSIQGGQSITLHKGDIVTVPANTPHQMLLPGGATLTYFVVKAEEAGAR